MAPRTLLAALSLGSMCMMQLVREALVHAGPDLHTEL